MGRLNFLPYRVRSMAGWLFDGFEIYLNWLASGRYGSSFQTVISKRMFLIHVHGQVLLNALRWMPQNIFGYTFEITTTSPRSQ